VSLTLGVLEEFERSEAAAVLAPATPSVQLKMKPAVLGALTPTPSKSFAPAATRQAEMEDEPVVDLTEPSSSLKWCEDEVAMEPEEDRAHG
jgi:hypothetical protein